MAWEIALGAAITGGAEGPRVRKRTVTNENTG
jgi:hypothetical protein